MKRKHLLSHLGLKFTVTPKKRPMVKKKERVETVYNTCVVCGIEAIVERLDSVTRSLRGFCGSCAAVAQDIQDRDGQTHSSGLSGKGGAEKMCPRCGHGLIYHRKGDCSRCGGLCI